MLVFELWKKILVLTVSICALLFCIPNFINKDSLNVLPDFLSSKQIRLGLDLQGGSYLLLEVEVNAIKLERLNNLADEIRVTLRSNEPKMGYKNILIVDDKLQFSLLSSKNLDLTKDLLNKIDKDLVISNDNDTRLIIDLSEDKMKELQTSTVLQSIEIIFFPFKK